MLDELLGSVLGPDERYRRVGVPFAVRVFADRCGLTKSAVDRGVRGLVERGLVVRLADGERRNAYRYQVVHPAWWPGESWEASELEALPPDVQRGWERPLLRLARGGPQVVPNGADRVPAERDTHARASLPFRKNRTREDSQRDPARFYVKRGRESFQLHEAVAKALDELFPAWEEIELDGWEKVPTNVATQVRELVQRAFTGAEGWSLDRFRLAIGLAVDVRELRRRDRDEEERMEAKRAAEDWVHLASSVLVRWKRVQEGGGTGPDDAEAEAAVGRVAAGKLEELEVAEALVALAEGRLRAAAENRVRAAEPEAEPVERLVEVAAAEPLVMPAAAVEEGQPALALPARFGTGRPAVAASATRLATPEELRARAGALLAALEGALARDGADLSATQRALAGAAVDHLRQRLQPAGEARLVHAVRQAEGLAGRLGLPTTQAGSSAGIDAIPGRVPKASGHPPSPSGSHVLRVCSEPSLALGGPSVPLLAASELVGERELDQPVPEGGGQPPNPEVLAVQEAQRVLQLLPAHLPDERGEQREERLCHFRGRCDRCPGVNFDKRPGRSRLLSALEDRNRAVERRSISLVPSNHPKPPIAAVIGEHSLCQTRRHSNVVGDRAPENRCTPDDGCPVQNCNNDREIREADTPDSGLRKLHHVLVLHPAPKVGPRLHASRAQVSGRPEQRNVSEPKVFLGKPENPGAHEASQCGCPRPPNHVAPKRGVVGVDAGKEARLVTDPIALDYLIEAPLEGLCLHLEPHRAPVREVSANVPQVAWRNGRNPTGGPNRKSESCDQRLDVSLNAAGRNSAQCPCTESTKCTHLPRCGGGVASEFCCQQLFDRVRSGLMLPSSRHR